MADTTELVRLIEEVERVVTSNAPNAAEIEQAALALEAELWELTNGKPTQGQVDELLARFQGGELPYPEFREELLLVVGG